MEKLRFSHKNYKSLLSHKTPKVLIAVFLIIAIVIPALAACADDGTTESEYVGDFSGTLTIWAWGSGYGVRAIQEAAEIYQRRNPDVDIQVTNVGRDDIQWAISFAARTGVYSDLPDIFLVEDYEFHKLHADFPNLFMDLTYTAIDFAEFSVAKTAFSTINGRNFGVPFDAGTAVMGLRTDVLYAAGLTIDDFTGITWDEFIALGSLVRDRTGYPMLSAVAQGRDLIPLMIRSAGGSFFFEDGSPNIADNPVVFESIVTYLRLVESGVLVEVYDWDDYVTSFSYGHGAVAGTIAGCWIVGSIQTGAEQEGNWAITNIPRLNTQTATNYSTWGGTSWAISSGSRNQELAIDFLRRTFAGSMELYDNLLHATGAFSTWLPSKDSAIYNAPQPFFGGQPIFADIMIFAGRAPAFHPGAFYQDAISVIHFAMSDIIMSGVDVSVAIDEAHRTLSFFVTIHDDQYDGETGEGDNGIETDPDEFGDEEVTEWGLDEGED